MLPSTRGVLTLGCRRRAASAAPRCRHFSTDQVIKEHDVLFLRQQGAKYPKWHLTAPLRPDSRVKLSYGASLAGEELIGRKMLDVVRDSGGHNVVLHEATLASYIINSERMATPIYPHDANTIVSLLDLNPSRPGEDPDDDAAPPFEIFEAGTGMGSLTLHLARAIHAANAPVPPPLRRALCEAKLRSRQDPSTSRVDLSPDQQAALDEYAATRRAVIHTLDRNPKHLHAAYKLVRNFRRAQYLASIDFHLGSVEEYLSGRLAQSDGQPFLSRAILDLPSAHENAEQVIRALCPNGLLVLFKPSISQVADFQAWALRTHQPLRLEKVLELPIATTTDGVHDAAGGRQWDVKTVVPKEHQGDESKRVQIMRPKVGDRIAGGGFVAVFRRWPGGDAPVHQDAETETQESE
ncbi:tRNA (adenine-N(1)-)-methyltransferase [Purpureocillium lilacinum]|uniref:tRNA (adenine(58)-N(1))-methyltransferase catalytic subunit TRM61 n=1 Tax=Purpureocillium lilacinum TaxID=33203 RepID=A0A179HT64_PURLI|nr:tRNA (adenine-N(1)-)-methyltransferase [Purpureocillium lilacinum]OAQ78592.1 tRNA (adenine-N(1)-)-methyltransferase [Purpureocillium lilacinum]OAQ93665.1 tRNA (adenine-N(1)-)-methyltransferase [Purpureocillium lilacinum]